MTRDNHSRHHPLVKLAREAILSFLRTEQRPAMPPEILEDPSLQRPAAAFVSLKESGQLRGCIGTILPARGSLAEEVVENAISAATRDPRFTPLTEDEMAGINITVDVLTEPEMVLTPEELDPSRYGIVVRSLGRTGVLLPALDGVDSVDTQLDIAMKKAGIESGDEMEILRFEVIRHL